MQRNPRFPPSSGRVRQERVSSYNGVPSSSRSSSHKAATGTTPFTLTRRPECTDCLRHSHLPREACAKTYGLPQTTPVSPMLVPWGGRHRCHCSSGASRCVNISGMCSTVLREASASGRQIWCVRGCQGSHMDGCPFCCWSVG